jgi:hypothetical protein
VAELLFSPLGRLTLELTFGSYIFSSIKSIFDPDTGLLLLAFGFLMFL